jgi:hypothetical protein
MFRKGLQKRVTPSNCQAKPLENRRRDRRRQEGGPQSAQRNLSGISKRLESEVRWAAKEYRCDVCEAKAQPKAARPTTIPRSFQPNRVIGVLLESTGRRESKPSRLERGGLGNQLSVS